MKLRDLLDAINRSPVFMLEREVYIDFGDEHCLITDAGCGPGDFVLTMEDFTIPDCDLCDMNICEGMIEGVTCDRLCKGTLVKDGKKLYCPDCGWSNEEIAEKRLPSPGE